jgi:hypothetical protein
MKFLQIFIIHKKKNLESLQSRCYIFAIFSVEQNIT